MKTYGFATALLFAALSGHSLAQAPGGGPSAPSRAGEAASASALGTGVAGARSQDPFTGGAPSGKPTPNALALSIKDVIDRALRYNLGLFIADQTTRTAQGARVLALSDLLPKVTWQTSETTEKLSLKAFGFPGLPGIPSIVGPFSVFDTRAYVSQSVVDFTVLSNLRAQTENVKAAQYTYKDARDLVVLAAANGYLQAIASASRVEAAEAELKTAQTAYDQAADMKKAGTVPGIDVLRAQVQLQTQRQKLIATQNDYQKAKLSLARAIGLPIGQPFELTDRIPYAPMQAMDLDAALQLAQHSRSDYQSAVALLRAAESNKKAARGEGLPTLGFNADYGAIGTAPGSTHGTFTVAANLRVPIFQGGLVRGKVMEAEALVERRRAELDDLRSRIDYDVRTSFMDLKAAGDQVQVATTGSELAKEQVKEAQDRFAAGVATTLEVVQAQEALATADENIISSLYQYNVAKATLARATGTAETAAGQFLGGKP